MASIGDALNDKSLQNLLKNKSIEIGDIFCIRLTQENGIVPKDGDDYRDKFLAILGKDDEGNFYGGVVINSKINQKVSLIIQQHHYPISKNDYHFLRYNSFIDCSSIMKAKKEKILLSEKVGEILEKDFDLIIETVKNCPIISNKEKKKFKLI